MLVLNNFLICGEHKLNVGTSLLLGLSYLNVPITGMLPYPYKLRCTVSVSLEGGLITECTCFIYRLNAVKLRQRDID